MGISSGGLLGGHDSGHLGHRQDVPLAVFPAASNSGPLIRDHRAPGTACDGAITYSTSTILAVHGAEMVSSPLPTSPANRWTHEFTLPESFILQGITPCVGLDRELMEPDWAKMAQPKAPRPAEGRAPVVLPPRRGMLRPKRAEWSPRPWAATLG